MIKVNLVGIERKKSSGGFGISAPASVLPVVLGLIVAGTATGGYLWYSSLSSELTDLAQRISAAEAKKAELDKVIKEDQVYESRRQELANRIKIIEGLKRDQISPVVSLDILGQAIDKTKFVWLSNLDQNNTLFSMSGVGTSVNSIADFVSNLEGTGYFHNVNLVNAQDSAGNFTFSMTTEFAPPARLQAVGQAPVSRGN